jgi:ketosteroid isomerase-like protein
MSRIAESWRTPLRGLLALLFALAPSAGLAAAESGAPAPAFAERPAVEAAIDAYRRAWLGNDPDAVLRTLTHDAILLPGPAAAAVVGPTAIRAYWWPTGAPFRITGFTQPVLDVQGSGTFAAAQGLSTVEWVAGQAAPTVSRSLWSAILRKDDDGIWRIHLLAWTAIP